MNFNNPDEAVYGYWSDDAARRYGVHEYQTYKGNIVRVTTVVSSHENAKRFKDVKFVACLAKYLGKVRN